MTTVPSTTIEIQLARPIIDLAGCVPTYATQTSDAVREGAYLWSRVAGLPMQVFVPTGDTITGKFAVAIRVLSQQRFDPGQANTTVSGLPARSTFADETWGELIWRLPDGTDAYLRTSAMTPDELIALAETLTPRPIESAIAGFDLTSDRYELLDEDVSPITIDAVTVSVCEFDNGGWMTASIITARPLGQALVLTDRPNVPMAIRPLDDGRLILVTGRDDIANRSIDALAALRNATDDEWTHITSADPASSETDATNPTTGTGN
ncbi:MAG: hypothetical protein AAB131_09115 [Actinomycetota bacterium]